MIGQRYGTRSEPHTPQQISTKNVLPTGDELAISPMKYTIYFDSPMHAPTTPEDFRPCPSFCQNAISHIAVSATFFSIATDSERLQSGFLCFSPSLLGCSRTTTTPPPSLLRDYCCRVAAASSDKYLQVINFIAKIVVNCKFTIQRRAGW